MPLNLSYGSILRDLDFRCTFCSLEYLTATLFDCRRPSIQGYFVFFSKYSTIRLTYLHTSLKWSKNIILKFASAFPHTGFYFVTCTLIKTLHIFQKKLQRLSWKQKTRKLSLTPYIRTSNYSFLNLSLWVRNSMINVRGSQIWFKVHLYLSERAFVRTLYLPYTC